MIDYRTLKDWPFPVIEHAYTIADTIRYALALGLGADPTDERQLAFVDDTRPGTPRALPTMAVILGYPGPWLRDPRTGVDFPRIVHGEESIVLHAMLPASGTVVASHRVTHVVDKGVGRGAVVVYEKELRDFTTGQRLATVTHTNLCRGDGGFSARDGLTDAAPPAPAKVPVREPDLVREFRTLPQQALLYRLCADRNPLHSDPAVARAAGFDRPILHGLCSFGIAGLALLESCCAFDPSRLRSLSARFSAPVYPGETMRVEMYRDGGETAFRARVAERDAVVVDAGRASFG